MISQVIIWANICNLLINSYFLVQIGFDDNLQPQNRQFVTVITSFFAGFNFHFACVMQRTWLTIIMFGLIRGWFLIGYAQNSGEHFLLNVPFGILLVAISLTTDFICIYLRLNHVKPANIKPPGC